MRRINWPVIITIILGLAVFSGASWYVFQYSIKNRPTEKVLVAARDIPAYRVIKAIDLQYRTIPEGGAEPGSVQDPNFAINKMTMIPLYANRQIPKQALTEDVLAIKSGERAVAVNVDLTGAVGNNLLPGDLVDVYWVPSKDFPGYIIAENARVLKIEDQNGNPVTPSDWQNKTRGLAQVAETTKQNSSLPAVAVLIVKNEYVPEITRTVVDGTVVLAKKRPSGWSVTAEETVKTETENDNQQQTSSGDQQKKEVNNNGLSTLEKGQPAKQ